MPEKLTERCVVKYSKTKGVPVAEWRRQVRIVNRAERHRHYLKYPEYQTFLAEAATKKYSFLWKKRFFDSFGLVYVFVQYEER